MFAWQAATPLPGTTTACRSIRPLAGRIRKLDCGTQVAEAITTCPVFWSAARIDHVAKANVSNPRIRMDTSKSRFISSVGLRRLEQLVRDVTNERRDLRLQCLVGTASGSHE